MRSPRVPDDMDMLLLLADAMGGGGSNAAIQRQEKQAQTEFVNSTVIPTKLNSGTEEDLTALGFKLGEQVTGDRLFRHAELPDGWKREGSDHDMWSYIVDGLGRRRCSVFFKGAFYDRDAFLSIDTVYGYIGHCLHEKTKPVLDDVWATRDAAKAAVLSHAEQNAKYLEMYEGDDDNYGRKRAAELRSEIAACQALHAALADQGEAETL